MLEQRLGDKLPIYQGDWTDRRADGTALARSHSASTVNRKAISARRVLHAIADAVTALSHLHIADESSAP